MKTLGRLIFSCTLAFMSITGIAQSNTDSKWVIDKNTSFTCQNIHYSEGCDTVVFRNKVNFVSAFVEINDAQEVLYIQKAKKLIIFSQSMGTLKMNDKKNGMKLYSDKSLKTEGDLTKAKYMEYILGEHSVHYYN